MIVAALSWWQEPPAALDRLIRSLDGVADRILAVDGRWSLMPGRSRLSSVEEVAALEQAAAHVGIPVDIEQPNRRWSQVQKRDHLMRRAADLGDWILIVDGDTHIAYCSRDLLRATLTETAEDVGLIQVTNVGGGVRSVWPRKRRLLYRAAAAVRVVTAHNGYQTPDGRWLNGDPDHVTLEPACDVSALLHMTHDVGSRGRERRGQQGDYYAARAGAGEEDMGNRLKLIARRVLRVVVIVALTATDSLLVIAGIGLLVYGIALVSKPAAFIAAGLLVAACGIGRMRAS